MKFKSLIAFFIITGVVVITSLSGCHIRDQVCTVSVEGILTDSLTGEPVPGIEVILLSNKWQSFFRSTKTLGHDTTDINGHYSLKNTLDCSDRPVMFLVASQDYNGSSDIPVAKNMNNQVNLKLKLR